MTASSVAKSSSLWHRTAAWLWLCGALCSIGAPASSQTAVQAVALDTPAWVNDLVIYEVATKSYTSPSGPESGTFKSLQARLPYLQDLGITGIWLTGHSLADPHHFYNIWTQYAVIEPDRLDPSLGTAEEFKAMVAEAHRRGIRIFLDVINHGVMSESPLVKDHPHWFRGGSWGMADFDWGGGHTDLDDWWVSLWTRAVTEYGVDGFRLDTNTPRPDLWARIRRNAFDAGHPIAIWEEGNDTIRGVTDFSQQDNRMYERELSGLGIGEFQPRVVRTFLNPVLVNDLPGYYDRKLGLAGKYTVDVRYADGATAHGDTSTEGVLRVRLEGLGEDRASTRMTDLAILPDGIPDVLLAVDNIGTGALKSVTVMDDSGKHWSTSRGWDVGGMSVERNGSQLRLFLSTRTYGSALLLSCHDNGWQGFPSGDNPYVAQGSRSLFGYSFLFTPMLPLFMAGEEFDATFRPLPGLSTDLFGGKDPGKGRWLYGAMLDWDELERPRHAGMLTDVKKMLQLRKSHRALLGPVRGDVRPNLKEVQYQSNISVPVPYVRWDNGTAIIVMGNRDTTADARITLQVPLAYLGDQQGARYRVTDLWNKRPSKIYSAQQLQRHTYTVRRDKTPGGGVGVLKIERLAQ